jgi:integrase
MSVYYNARADRWCIAIQRGGKRITRYAEQGSTKEEAIQYEAKILRDYFLTDKLGKTSDRSIAEAIQRWLAEEVAHYKSKVKTTSHILQLTDFVLDRRVSEIHLVAEEYAKKHRKLLSPGTINRRLSMLRLIANLCYKKWDWLDRPLGQKIKLLKESEGRVPLLSQSELNSLLAACQNEYSRTAIKLAAYCGLRAEEIQKLKPEHVKQDHLWLAFEQKAGVSIESVPLPESFKLTPSMLPIGISHRMISRYFRRALAEIGRDDLRFHDLRHAYGSWLVQNGVDLYLTGKLLRHKSLASTKRYAHFADAQKQDAVKKAFG